jgi:cyclopropane-fatty-acyl-phospholipid synthase
MSRVQSLSLADDPMPAAGRLFLSLLSRLKIGFLKVTTPQGEGLVFGDTHAGPAAHLHLRDWRACGRIMAAGDIGFAEAWRAGWIDTPDLPAVLRLALRNQEVLDRAIFGGRIKSMWFHLKHLLRANTREGSRRNIHAHYDIGNAFYQLWLDPTWTYSSAIFDGNLDQTLAQAQAAKYQRIVDVLGLKAGDRVLEIGCGWGGFAEHAVRLGIAVHGVTISPAQLESARIRLGTQGLNGLAQLELCDYRDLRGEYDAVVSIEMFEAVGERFWGEYFDTVRARLKPGGRAMVQSITIDERHFARYRGGSDFIQQFIFPGGMLPSVPRFQKVAARHGLTTLDAYAFGRDYAETLRRWRHAFEEQRAAIEAQGFDEAFMRIWQMYLCYCEAGFDEGRTDVVQFMLSRDAGTAAP